MKVVTITGIQLQYDNLVDPTEEDISLHIAMINRVLERIDVQPQIKMTVDSKVTVIEVKDDEIEKDDDEMCSFCGERCWEGEMCDEQQAGGFN